MSTIPDTNAKTRNRADYQIFFKKKGRTKQAHADECDINQIMAKFQETGAITHANNHQANYDFVSGLTFTQSMEIVTTAGRMFDELPSSLRKRFNHDPAQYLTFVQDPANLDAMGDLGLLTPEATAARIVAIKATEALSTPPIVDPPIPGEATDS